MKTIKASDLKCSNKKCKEMAVAFFPIVDIDIPSYPFCRKCLDKERLKLMIQLKDL